MHEIAMRRQWMDRLQETEAFFVTIAQKQPCFIVYEPRIREGAINHHNETMELSFWMTLVPDEVWVNSVNQVVANVARDLRASGRAESWGLDWPTNHVSINSPFTNRTSNIVVVAELINDQGVSIGMQTVNIPAGYHIHSRVSRAIVARQWEGDVVFPAVDINLIPSQLSIRVTSIDGLSAEDAARHRGIIVMPNEEFFLATGIRRAPMDTSQFTVQPDGMLTFWGGTETEVVIPFMVNGVHVTAIGNNVFQNRGLTSVIIPDTVTSIGQNAFCGNQLTNLSIPNSVTAIGANAFSGRDQWNRGNLRSVNISDSVAKIGNEAFANNELTSVTIPDSVTSIGSAAFLNNRLTLVTIPDSVTSIGDFAFGDNQLTGVTIGNSVRTIGSRAFSENVTSIIIGAGVDIKNSFPGTDQLRGDSFSSFYAQSGRRAGRYTRSGNGANIIWAFTPR